MLSLSGKVALVSGAGSAGAGEEADGDPLATEAQRQLAHGGLGGFKVE